MIKNDPAKSSLTNIRKFLFVLGFVVTILLGVSMGRAGSLLSLQGALLGSGAVGVSVLITYFLLRLVFPSKTDKTNMSYISGFLTIFLGIVSFIAWGVILSNSGFTAGSMTLLVLTGILWTVMIAFLGMETPVFLGFILGAVLGGAAYVAILTYFPQFFYELFNDELSRAETLQVVQYVYGLLGAFTGAIGSTIVRASGLGIREPYHVEEL